MENIYFDFKKLKHLGKGAIIGKCVRIRRPELVSIGDNTIIDDFTYISCEMTIGSYCHIASNVTISGGKQKITIGNFVGISAGCSIHASSSDYICASFELPSIPDKFHFGGTSEPISIDDHVLLGAQSVVLPGVHLPIGFASTAHTVIRKNTYKSWYLYGGYQCKKLYKRSHNEVLKTVKHMGL